MKKQLISLVAMAGFTMGATIAYAGSTAGSGISGSKHDMNMLPASQSVGVKDSQGRICAFCHTPHHKVPSGAADYNPLWSHTVAAGQYVAYESVTFDGIVAADPLTGPSRLCMSCHDGIIAVDQHYGISSSTTNARLAGDNWGQIAVGKDRDLTNDHPIGFDITNYPAGDTSGGGGMPIFGTAIRANLLAPNNPKLDGAAFAEVGFNNGVTKVFTCASCHEVHNKDNADSFFLYEKQDGSKICLMCHDK